MRENTTLIEGIKAEASVKPLLLTFPSHFHKHPSVSTPATRAAPTNTYDRRVTEINIWYLMGRKYEI